MTIDELITLQRFWHKALDKFDFDKGNGFFDFARQIFEKEISTAGLDCWTVGPMRDESFDLIMFGKIFKIALEPGAGMYMAGIGYEIADGKKRRIASELFTIAGGTLAGADGTTVTRVAGEKAHTLLFEQAMTLLLTPASAAK